MSNQIETAVEESNLQQNSTQESDLKNTEKNESINELKSSLVSLFNQLGLHAQASSIEQNKQLDNLTTVSLVEVLKKHQVAYSLVPFSKQAIANSNFPFLIIPNESDVLVARRKEQQVDILATNNHWLALDKFDDYLDGHVLIIEGLPTTKQTVKAFAQQMSKRTKWYQPVFWLSLLSSLTGLAVPLFTMAVYDRVIGGQAPDVLPKIALGATLALIIFASARLVRAKLLATVSNRFARDLSDMTYHRLLSLPLMVLSRVGLSNHIARMRNAEKVRTLLSGPAGAALVDLPFTLIALITITFLSGWLVLVPLIMLVVFYLVMKLLNKYAQAATPTISGEYQNAVNELSKKLLQLKASGENGQWTQHFFRQCREASRQNFLFAKRQGLNAAVSHALSMLTALITVFAGIFLVLNQSISAGTLIASVMLIWRITGPAQVAFSSGQKITMMKGAAEQFDRFMQANTEYSELRLDQTNFAKPPSINFEHVTLRYGADVEPALSGISASIESGELVAVVGPNGSGKSTLLHSIVGIIEPQAGFITVNSKNLKQFDPESYRQHIAFCPAQPDILAESLGDNLRIVKADASDDEIKQALVAAGGQSLLDSLNGDIEAKIFTSGDVIHAAAEASYISLARALLKQSTLIVLDEPIANRNPSAKAQFIKTVSQLKGQATMVFSSHDPELIKLADKVIVLDKGTVAFAGPLPDENKSTENKVNENSQPINKQQPSNKQGLHANE